MNANPLPPDILRVLAAADELPGPTEQQTRRVRSRIAVTVGAAGGVAATAAATKTATAAAGGSSALGLKSLAIVVAVGLAGGGVYVGARLAARPEAALAPVMARAPSTAREPGASGVQTPAEPPRAANAADEVAPATTESAADEPVTRARVRPTAPPPSRERETLGRERAVLDRARGALARGEHALALSVVGGHARQFPRGELAEERELLRVTIYAARGDRPAAAKAASKFSRAFPNSVYQRAVDAALRSSETDLTGSDQ